MRGHMPVEIVRFRQFLECLIETEVQRKRRHNACDYSQPCYELERAKRCCACSQTTSTDGERSVVCPICTLHWHNACSTLGLSALDADISSSSDARALEASYLRSAGANISHLERLRTSVQQETLPLNSCMWCRCLIRL